MYKVVLTHRPFLAADFSGSVAKRLPPHLEEWEGGGELGFTVFWADPSRWELGTCLRGDFGRLMLKV